MHGHNIRIPTLDIAMYIFPNSLPIWRTREIENTIPRPRCVRIKWLSYYSTPDGYYSPTHSSTFRDRLHIIIIGGISIVLRIHVIFFHHFLENYREIRQTFRVMHTTLYSINRGPISIYRELWFFDIPQFFFYKKYNYFHYKLGYNWSRDIWTLPFSMSYIF